MRRKNLDAKSFVLRFAGSFVFNLLLLSLLFLRPNPAYAVSFETVQDLWVNGNAGIGTTNPLASLDVAGTGIRLGGVTRTSWPTNSQWTTSGNDIYYTTGLVGIGTAGPSGNLHVYGNNSSGDKNVVILQHATNDTSTSNVDLQFVGGNGVNYAGIKASNPSSNVTNLEFSNWNASARAVRMGIYGTNGNLGIGTTSPTAKLYVNGSAYAAGATLGGNLNLNWAASRDFYVDEAQNGNYGGDLRIQAGNGEDASTESTSGGNLYIDGGNSYNTGVAAVGNIYIGSRYASPVVIGSTATTGAMVSITELTNSLLTLYNTSTAANNNRADIGFWNKRTTSGATNVATVSGVITDITQSAYKGALTFSTANNATPAERVRIDYLGNVGIGTSGPGAKLEVVGDIVSKGTSWTTRTSAADSTWNSVTYGDGLFVAVASDSTRVMTSPNGITWTGQSGVAASWYGVVYGNGLFVAVGIGSQAMTSSDGVNWTSRTCPNSNWMSVAYGNRTFVAVSNSGAAMSSPDGITWTTQNTPASNPWRSATYGNGLFVAVSSDGIGNRVMTSPDGTTWTSRTSAVDNNWFSVTYGNGLFVAVSKSGTGNRVMTSPDGTTWTSRTSAVDNNWSSVTYGNGLFVAVSNSSIMTSPDGITWTSRTSAAENVWNSVTYGNGLFVAVSYTGTGNRVMTSGKSELNVVSINNLYQGGMNINGSVGIGTTAPSATLEVNGNLKAKMQTDLGGNTAVWGGASAGTVYELGYDVAELFDASEEVEVGDILVVDTAAANKVCKSKASRQGNILGVVSGAPAILFEGSTMQLAPKPGEFTKGLKPPVGLAGRIAVKVCLENGPVAVGDYITTSSKPGVGMKANPEDPVVGIALDKFESSDTDISMIRVFILKDNKAYVQQLEKRMQSLQEQIDKLSLRIENK